ncbi:MAG: hypothetical protein WA975_00860 [Mesorhizobium sp.]
MGRVLSFTPRTAAGGQPPRAPGAAAAVIIFPGIRYEPQKGAAGGNVGHTPGGPQPTFPRPAPRH